MREFQEIQKLLLDWFRHNGNVNYNQAKVACQNILGSFNYEKKNAIFKVLLPLVRQGFIDFKGEGTYCISPPAIFYYKEMELAVSINMLPEQKKVIAISEEKFEEDAFGVIRFETSQDKAKELANVIGCLYSEPDIRTFLSEFPRIIDVVESFSIDYVDDKFEIYDIENFRWRNSNSKELGLIRRSKGQKIYIRTEENNFAIPDIHVNPDARPLAESYCAIKYSSKSFFRYYPEQSVLFIEKLNIPILIDRLLVLAGLWDKNGVERDFGFAKYYNINMAIISQLNRIFQIKIPFEA